KKTSAKKEATVAPSNVTSIDQNSPQSGSNAAGTETASRPAESSSRTESRSSETSFRPESRSSEIPIRQAESSTRTAGPEIIEQIRARAYELFEQRGRLEGYDQQDWAQAEAEILVKFQREKSA